MSSSRADLVESSSDELDRHAVIVGFDATQASRSSISPADRQVPVRRKRRVGRARRRSARRRLKPLRSAVSPVVYVLTRSPSTFDPDRRSRVRSAGGEHDHADPDQAKERAGEIEPVGPEPVGHHAPGQRTGHEDPAGGGQDPPEVVVVLQRGDEPVGGERGDPRPYERDPAVFAAALPTSQAPPISAIAATANSRSVSATDIVTVEARAWSKVKAARGPPPLVATRGARWRGTWRRRGTRTPTSG